MSLKSIDLADALRRVAERRIEDAMREGKFDNLRGAGEPIDLEPLPADENARMNWWALRILRQNDVIPDEVRWRKALDALKDRLALLEDEAHLPALVGQINALVRQVNTLGTNALPGNLSPLDLETERSRLRARVNR